MVGRRPHTAEIARSTRALATAPVLGAPAAAFTPSPAAGRGGGLSLGRSGGGATRASPRRDRRPTGRLGALGCVLALAACAGPLDVASDAYTAVYAALAESARTDADLDRLDRIETCWVTLYSRAEAALAAGTPRAAVVAVTAQECAPPGGGP